MEYRYRVDWRKKLILQVGVKCSYSSSLAELEPPPGTYTHWSDAKSEDLVSVPLEKLAKFKIFRFRPSWSGKLILQIGKPCTNVYVADTHVWRDATIQELTAVGTDK